MVTPYIPDSPPKLEKSKINTALSYGQCVDFGVLVLV